MSGGIGHNQGPAFGTGYTYRLGLWRKARRELIPNTLPLEILRRRVTRAKELGLGYKTYASIRASSGRDVIGFLFSDNALRIRRAQLRMAEDRFAKLSRVVECRVGAAVHAPIRSDEVSEANPLLSFVGRAPSLISSWSETEALLRSSLPQEGMPTDGVLVIGDTALEREWCSALRAGFYLPADRYFGPNP